MKSKIISSSDFMKASAEGCCSPRRFLDSCVDCDKVMNCKHPEARKGKHKILDNKIAEAKKQIKKWKEEKSALSSISE